MKHRKIKQHKHPDFQCDHPAGSPEYCKEYRIHIKICHPEIHEKRKAEGRRRADTKTYQKYGMTRKEFNHKFFVEQDGRCACCGTTSFGSGNGRHGIVDHDHHSGKIRGIICHKCNIGIGFFDDNPIILQQAATYLDRFDDKRDFGL